MELKVNEIFSTIQGEGSWAGTPATFVRLSKCNLSCEWCDTEFEKFESLEIGEILVQLSHMPARHIVVTGGEPTLQLDKLFHLVHDLRVSGFKVGLETNGTRDFNIDRFDHVTLSPKENVVMAKPSQDKNRVVRLKECDDLKVIDNGGTLSYHSKILERLNVRKGCYLQPLSNSKESVERCVKMIRNQSLWKLSLQTHKMIGLP